MLPSRFGGSRPPVSAQLHRIFWAVSLVGICTFMPAVAHAAHSTQVESLTEGPSAMPRSSVLSSWRLGASVAQVRGFGGSSQGAAFSLLSLEAQTPRLESLGLQAELQMDAPSLNGPGRGFSVKFDPGRADYGLALKMTPSYLPVGLEYNRLAGNSAATVDPRAYAASSSGYLLDSGASQLFSLRHQGLHHRARLGWGSMGVESNVAPMLLGLHGFLPVHGRATGPFATLSAERLRILGFVGRAGVMLMLDTRAHGMDRGDYLAWGLTMHRALGEGLILGTSYMAGNSSLPGTSAPSTLSFYLRLRWNVSPAH